MGEQTGMSRAVYMGGNVPKDSGNLNEDQIAKSLEFHTE